MTENLVDQNIIVCTFWKVNCGNYECNSDDISSTYIGVAAVSPVPLALLVLFGLKHGLFEKLLMISDYQTQNNVKSSDSSDWSGESIMCCLLREQFLWLWITECYVYFLKRSVKTYIIFFSCIFFSRMCAINNFLFLNLVF